MPRMVALATARHERRRNARGRDELTEGAPAGCAPRITERKTMRRVARELKFLSSAASQHCYSRIKSLCE